MAYAEVQYREHTEDVRIDLTTLQSKVKFDNLNSLESTKPESGNSGFKENRDSVGESANDGDLYSSMIADTPNSYKYYGVSMENNGYFIIPRSLASDERFLGAKIKYQKVLYTILKRANFSPTPFAIGSETIIIEAGQWCVSERSLVEYCNEGVKFKEDLVDKNIVRRAVHFFSRCGFVNHEVIHDRTLITVTISGVYDKDKIKSEPPSEPEVNQQRTTKEEVKEDKEEYIHSKKERFTPSPLATSLLADFYDSLFLSIPDFPKERTRKTKTQYQSAERLLKKYSEDVLKKVIEFAHKPGGFWVQHVHSLNYLEKKIITLMEQMKNPMNKNKIDVKPSRHNNPNYKPKEEKPMAYVNKISFNTEEYLK